MLGHLLAAGSAHRLQDRALRDEELRRALELSQRSPAARSAEEGARLLAAEWALDDRDAPRALELLNALPPGVARRTHALRLKLQAARLGRPAAGGAEDGAPADQAPGLLEGRRRRPAALARLRVARRRARRRPAAAALAARSMPADRRDPFVAARAATRRPRARRARRGARLAAAVLGASSTSSAPTNAPRSREALDRRGRPASAPNGCRGSSRRCRRSPRDGAIALAAGSVLAERQLWGKARRLLEQAASDAALAAAARRKAWLALAELAEAAKATRARAARCYESAARQG